MDVFLEVLILLVVARLGGELAERAGQSAPVGELLAGVALAGAVLLLGPGMPVLSGIGESQTVLVIAQAGVFFLILQAGVDLEPEELKDASFDALLVALGGFLLPLAGGYLAGYLLLPEGEARSAQALVVGVAMAITAIPATLRVLEAMGLLHGRVGRTIVAAALFDDILGMLVLAVLTAVIAIGRVPPPGDLLIMLVKVGVFFAITALLGTKLYPHLHRRIEEMEAASLEVSLLVAVALGYGLIAELLGVHWIMGAFMAGLYYEKARVGDAIYRDTQVFLALLTQGLLGPIFFLSIGLQVEVRAVLEAPLLVIGLTLLAFFTKAAGAGGMALIRGFPVREAATLGTGMTARGAVELIILGIVAEAGLFPRDGEVGVGGYLLSALVVMAIVNTLAMPLLMKRLQKTRA